MIDMFMALWNAGFVGKVLKVLSAFLLICISISLLLFTVGTPGAERWSFLQFAEHHVRGVVDASDLTATALSRGRTSDPAASAPAVLPCPSIPARGSRVSQGHGRGKGRPYDRSTTTRLSPTPTVTAGNSTTTPTEQDGPTPVSTEQPTEQPTSAAYPTVLAMPTLTPAATGTGPTTKGAAQRGVAESWQGAIVSVRTDIEGVSVLTRIKSDQVASGSSGNCLNDSLADTVYGADVATLEHSLMIIIAGSLLGTCLFYCLAFALKRRKSS